MSVHYRMVYIVMVFMNVHSLVYDTCTRDVSKPSSNRLNFARKGHETVARAHSYFAIIPEGVRHVLIAVASSSSKLQLLKYGKAH